VWLSYFRLSGFYSLPVLLRAGGQVGLSGCLHEWLLTCQDSIPMTGHPVVGRQLFINLSFGTSCMSQTSYIALFRASCLQCVAWVGYAAVERLPVSRKQCIEGWSQGWYFPIRGQLVKCATWVVCSWREEQELAMCWDVRCLNGMYLPVIYTVVWCCAAGMAGGRATWRPYSGVTVVRVLFVWQSLALGPRHHGRRSTLSACRCRYSHWRPHITVARPAPRALHWRILKCEPVHTLKLIHCWFVTTWQFTFGDSSTNLCQSDHTYSSLFNKKLAYGKFIPD